MSRVEVDFKPSVAKVKWSVNEIGNRVLQADGHEGGDEDGEEDDHVDQLQHPSHLGPVAMDDDHVPEDGDGDGEEVAVHSDEDVHELRQDDASNQADVVGHGKDEEVEGEVDEEDGVEDAVDDGVRAEDAVDGCARALPSSPIEDSKNSNLI